MQSMSTPKYVCAVVLAMAGLTCLPSSGNAQPTTTRVSVSSAGEQGNDHSFEAVISADGRFVAFASRASNLVAGDTNGAEDVFVHDRQTGAMTRVSVSSAGVQGNGVSFGPAISADGRYVAFHSGASNLVAGDTNGADDVFVHDRQTGATTRVSVSSAGVQGNSLSDYPAISADGRFVAFWSGASNLVAGDTNGFVDVFVHDRQTGATTRVSVSSAGLQGNHNSGFTPSFGPALSADGRFVAFASDASNLVAGDTNGVRDIFVHDRQTGATTRVSVSSAGVQGNNLCGRPGISADGRHVAFHSDASNLVAGDTNGTPDVFVHDRQTGATTRVSVSNASEQGNDFSVRPVISADGRFVAFWSGASNLVAGDTNGINDVFVHDRQTGATTRVSVSSPGEQGNGGSADPSISADGRYVAFASAASNLVADDTNGINDVFVRSNVVNDIALDRTSLRYAAVTSGGTWVWQTAPQIVRLRQVAATTVNWSATPNQPWLHVGPASGSGSADLVVSVVPSATLPAQGVFEGVITFSAEAGAQPPGPLQVTLTLIPAGASAPPFGLVDTPVDHSTGVSGAVPFTGWALDDIEVEGVTLCRAAVAGEAAPVDGRCGGAAQIFIGDAVFIDGARPDVAAAFPTFPRSTRAGWGFMVLTNMLPDVARGLPTGGNGTFIFQLYARDREGHVTLLGTRTMTCDNEHATRPFGTIDTPGQGEVVSGSNYVNFGWALTPNPKFIPMDGSTITVFVNGVAVGSPSYGHFRPDIAGFFPGLANSDGAVGFHVLDTTAMPNGLYTIAWGVTDNLGVSEGLGSRYFTVSNGVAAASAAPEASASLPPDRLRQGSGAPPQLSAHAEGASDGSREQGPPQVPIIEALPVDRAAIRGRRGFHPDAPWREYLVGGSGRAILRGEELDRFELRLADEHGNQYAGYLRVGNELAPLPIGSHLDGTAGRFTWAPGVGFVGTYDLVFVRSAGGRAVARQEVRIVLAPKRSGRRGPQVVIDTPGPHWHIEQPFLLAGWAADLDADTGTGVDTLHVWAYPLTGGPPIFLGVADFGGARPDVAEVHGAQFRASGYGLLVQGLAAGHYDLAVFAWSTVSGGFVPAQLVRVAVR